MAVMDKVIELQDRMISDLQNVQTRIVDLNKRAFEATSNLPSVDMPKLDFIPGVDEAPAPERVVSNGFDFAGKLLATNREFAEQLVSIWVPETETEVEAAAEGADDEK